MNHNAEVLICLGANTCDKEAAIAAAYDVVARLGIVTADSGVYPSPPEGTPANAEPYDNRLIKLNTELTFTELLRTCKAYESNVRAGHHDGGVAIDIDIITYDGAILRPKDWASAYMSTGLARLHPIADKVTI